MDTTDAFDINISKWANPLNLYTDGIIKSLARGIRSALEASDVILEDTCRVVPCGSQYFDSAISVNTPADMYLVNIKDYYYDVQSTIDTTTLNLPTEKIDYKKYRHDVYKDMQKYFNKSNVSLVGNTIYIKKENYKVHLKPAVAYHAYTNVIDKNGDTIVVFVDGVAMPSKDDGLTIYYPYQEEKNYHIANVKTDYRFNSIVRVFKHLADWISRKEGHSSMIHSYLITCLIYNVPNVIIKRMSGYDDAILEIVDYLYDVLTTDLYKEMYEINDIKLLFSSKQIWSRENALNFVVKAKKYVKYIV